MKLGIITQPVYINYGGILQAYALQTILERFGHEVSLVQEKCIGYQVPHGLGSYVRYSKRFLYKLLGLSSSPVYVEKMLNNQRLIISQYTRQFASKYLHLSEINTYEDLESDSYEGYVVGSDQVWRPAYNNLNNTYLGFAERWNVKRIAYAASFGTDEKEYTAEQIDRYTPLIRRFNAVSVRENSGVTLCKEYFGIQAQHVLDPTLLLGREDYIRLVEDKGIGLSEGNLFVYLLDENEEKKVFVNRVAKEKNLTPFSVKAKSDYNYAPLSDRIQPPIEQWLRGFIDADYVVTDSFHGCVFSILFNKPFLAIGNSDRGLARFDSLLRMFNLEDRLVLDIRKQESILDTSIDWEKVNHILVCQRELAYSFITNSIQ